MPMSVIILPARSLSSVPETSVGGMAPTVPAPDGLGTSGLEAYSHSKEGLNSFQDGNLYCSNMTSI